MAQGRLATMAAQMVAAAQAKDESRQELRLARGLLVVLERTGLRWRLALGREDVWPSTAEIAICGAAFGAPVGAGESSKEVKSTTKTGRELRYKVVELVWTEAEMIEEG